MAGGNLTLRDSLLPAVDTIRGIPAQFGLRLHTVQIVLRTWTGTRVGLGTNADTSTGIKQDLGIYPIKVRNVSEREVVASGGVYTDQDVVVGPITPPFAGSTLDNDAISIFDPTPGTSPAEVFFKITGPGYPTTGAWFKKLSQNVSKPMRYTFVCRKTAELE